MDTMDWPTLIAQLKAIMERDQVSSRQLATSINISESSVRNYLALRSRASIATRERIEQYVEEAQQRFAKQNVAEDGAETDAEETDTTVATGETNATTPDASSEPASDKQDDQETAAAKALQNEDLEATDKAVPEADVEVAADASKDTEADATTTTEPATDAKQEESHPVTPSLVKTPAVAKTEGSTPLRIYVDESFGRIPEKPFTVGMVLASTDLGVMPFKEFTDTLYPFGWAPGDEVKAAGKDLANVKNILKGSQNDDIRMFAFRTTTAPSLITVTDDDSTTVAIFPYVSALINAIETMQRGGLKATSFQIVIDRTNKLPAETQRVMEKLLDVYFRLSGNQIFSFHITDGDSRAQKGLQLADFVAHYAYVEDEDKITTFAPVTGVLDDALGNARRFAFYSGLRLLRLKDDARVIAGQFAAKESATEMVTNVEPEPATETKTVSRAFTYTVDLRDTIIGAQQLGLGGKQLEAVRSRLKGLSTTVTNWLLESQSPLVDGLANRTISDFRQRAVVITRVDKPFRPDSEIGEQQFRIFESQLERVKELIQSYQSTSED